MRDARDPDARFAHIMKECLSCNDPTLIVV